MPSPHLGGQGWASGPSGGSLTHRHPRSPNRGGGGGSSCPGAGTLPPAPCRPSTESPGSSRKAGGPRGSGSKAGEPGPGAGAPSARQRGPGDLERRKSQQRQRQHRQRGGEGGAGGGAGSTSTRVAQGSSGSELSRKQTHISHVSLAGPTAGRCNGGGLWAAPTLEPRSLKMISTSKIFPNCCRDRDGGGGDRRGCVKTAGPASLLPRGPLPPACVRSSAPGPLSASCRDMKVLLGSLAAGWGGVGWASLPTFPCRELFPPGRWSHLRCRQHPLLSLLGL